MPAPNIAPVPGIAPQNLPAATPVQIDTVLADIWGRYYLVMDKVEQKRAYRKDYADRLAAVDAGKYRWSYSDSDRTRDTNGVAKMDAQIAELLEQGDTILAEADPYEAEFARRGGWTRAYLVTTSGRGHVHRTRACTTCYPTTRFSWIIDFSGATEDDVVQAAGSGACTVCFPSAPVEYLSRPCTIEDPKAKEARLEREQAKAARDAAKAAKAIANPDGTALRTRYVGQINTLVTAERTYVDLASYLQHLTRGRPESDQLVVDYRADLDRIVAALAHKLQVTQDAVVADRKAKVDKKFRRDYS